MKHLLLAALLSAALPAAMAANPTHVYLMNNAADALGGPALVSLGGSFGTNAYGQTGYSFGADQGLSLAGALNSSVYSIDFALAFDNIDGYRRLVDFKNLASDTGLYVLSSALNFYNDVTGPADAFAVQQLARVTITRDATGVFSGYVNGVAQFSFNDNGQGIFSEPGQIAYFFRDDLSVGGESSAGFVDYIRIYDVALTAGEVASLPAIPEPASWALMLGGALALLARRRSLSSAHERHAAHR